MLSPLQDDFLKVSPLLLETPLESGGKCGDGCRRVRPPRHFRRVVLSFLWVLMGSLEEDAEGPCRQWIGHGSENNSHSIMFSIGFGGPCKQRALGPGPEPHMEAL